MYYQVNYSDHVLAGCHCFLRLHRRTLPQGAQNRCNRRTETAVKLPEYVAVVHSTSEGIRNRSDVGRRRVRSDKTRHQPLGHMHGRVIMTEQVVQQRLDFEKCLSRSCAPSTAYFIKTGGFRKELFMPSSLTRYSRHLQKTAIHLEDCVASTI